MINIRRCDFHTHILPMMDDGAGSVDESVKMLKSLYRQGVTDVCLTPHYNFTGEDRKDFISRRDNSLSALLLRYDGQCMPKLFTGCELYLTKDVSSKDFSGLCLGKSDVLLLEFPREQFREWMLDEIEKLLFVRHIKVMIAHIDRVLKLYSRDICDDIFDYTDLIFQINASALTGLIPDFALRRRCDDGASFVIGTDAHGAVRRAPNYQAAARRLDTPYYRNNIKASADATSAALISQL